MFSGKANKQRTVTLGGSRSSNKDSSKPGTLDARFSRLKDLKGQAERRQSNNRTDKLNSKRGVQLPPPSSQAKESTQPKKDKKQRRPKGRSVKLPSAERPTAVFVGSNPGRRRKAQKLRRKSQGAVKQA